MSLAIGDQVGVEVMRRIDDGRIVRWFESGVVVAIGEPYGVRIAFDNGGTFEGDIKVGVDDDK